MSKAVRDSEGKEKIYKVLNDNANKFKRHYVERIEGVIKAFDQLEITRMKEVSASIQRLVAYEHELTNEKMYDLKKFSEELNGFGIEQELQEFESQCKQEWKVLLAFYIPISSLSSSRTLSLLLTKVCDTPPSPKAKNETKPMTEKVSCTKKSRKSLGRTLST